ncbi:hypothetical protein P4O66_022376, partial [Electrophorus voltai]
MAPHVMTLFSIAVWTLAVPLLLFMASFMSWPSFLISLLLVNKLTALQSSKTLYVPRYWRRTLVTVGGIVSVTLTEGGLASGLPNSCCMTYVHKDAWLSVFEYLPKHLHLPCVDMPGHEGTTRTNVEDHSVQDQVRRIR